MLDLDDEDSDKDWIRGRMGLVGELIERKGLGEVLRHDDMFTQVRSGVFPLFEELLLTLSLSRFRWSTPCSRESRRTF